jgi:hypothetical protein
MHLRQASVTADGERHFGGRSLIEVQFELTFENGRKPSDEVEASPKMRGASSDAVIRDYEMTDRIRIDAELDRYEAAAIAGKAMPQSVGHELLRNEAYANLLMSRQLDIGHVQ